MLSLMKIIMQLYGLVYAAESLLAPRPSSAGGGVVAGRGHREAAALAAHFQSKELHEGVHTATSPLLLLWLPCVFAGAQQDFAALIKTTQGSYKAVADELRPSAAGLTAGHPAVRALWSCGRGRKAPP